MRILRRRPGRITSILLIMGCLAVFNICNTVFHQWSLEIKRKFSRAPRRSPENSHEDPPITNITYYNLAKNERYDYEFHFEYTNHIAGTNPRLMILLNGNSRSCSDYWNFPVGRRILSLLRYYQFSILAICSKRRAFDKDISIEENLDVKWIYHSLQKWMDEIYFKQFKQYPRLYTHGISRGSTIAVALSRILPIQGQIVTLFPGRSQGFTTYSDHSPDLQIRLQLDPVFANWFYFDFCYTKKLNSEYRHYCPFQNKNDRHYQPVPPSYFIHSTNDDLFNLTEYVPFIIQLRRDSFNLGGSLLNDSSSVGFHIVSPATLSPTYMKDMFDPWRSKPDASSIFYQHFTNQHLYKTKDPSRRTCACLPIDFTYYERFPNITETWSEDSQNRYTNYVNEVKKHQVALCEEVCGDLMTAHAMSSRHLDRVLDWTARTDSRRRTLYVKDYLTRPLRIWMYDKNTILPKTQNFSPEEAYFVNISKTCQLYSPEYYLQEYFQQLKAASTTALHKFQWANNPLLADYFIIPSDITYYSCSHKDGKIGNQVHKLNTEYFNILLNNIRMHFPYWTMTKKSDHMGSNHILTIVTDRNMGIFYDDIRKVLRNVIQIVFTGIRGDISNSGQGPSTIYRHRYDVVIPPFTRILPEKNPHENISNLFDQKTCLFSFAGPLSYASTDQSARSLLSSAWLDMKHENKNNMTVNIGGKQYQTMNIVDGIPENADYIKLVQSSVFALSPEGYVPWTSRLYDAIQIGSIPTILSDKIVLPFERFIDWASFSTKINVNKIRSITEYASRIDSFDKYVKRKLRNVIRYKRAFRWPYSTIEDSKTKRHEFLPDEDEHGLVKNVFHYISLELRCRRLEQFYGLSVISFSKKSKNAQQKACSAYPNICPCHGEHPPVAFQEFL